MTQIHRPGNPIEELQFALAEADAQRPPDGLGHSVLGAALAARSAGRPADEPAPITAVEGFRRSVASFDGLLGSLDSTEWRRRTVRALDVQGLVGHLIGVERHLLVSLHEEVGGEADADHVESTDPVAAAQRDRPPSETHDDWRAAVAETFEALADDSLPARRRDSASLHGLRMPLDDLVVARTFEMWTHEEDIRRATGRPLQAPDAASLRLMTDLAITLVPAAMTRSDRPGAGHRARIVLTGPGGGTWQTALDARADGVGPEGPVDVRIVVDAAEFCRLVANRVDPAALAAIVSGDGSLATDLFAGIATLALD